MYYISKFCRICVETDVKLLDLDTIDFDKVKLSEKLEVCTKMVVTRESLSTQICLQCLSKLRTSYQFLDMCRKSSKKLQSYYKTLLCKQNEQHLKNIVNTDLQVVVTPIRVVGYNRINDICEDNETTCTQEKRKRITKEQRCLLLKKLLANSDKSNGEWCKSSQKFSGYNKSSSESLIGGLRSIINFTRNYDFDICLDKNSKHEATPLEKLSEFSDEFFRNDFSEFKRTILFIIENKDNLYESGDSDDDYFNFPSQEELWQSNEITRIQCEHEGTSNQCFQSNSEHLECNSKENILKFEEVIVEPDIKIKNEMDYEGGEHSMDNSLDITQCKQEIKEESDYNDYFHTNSSSLNSYNSDYPIVPTIHVEKVNSMMSLNNFVGNYQHKRTFSPNNARCRTRENPYINPFLKQQFLYRSFRCDKCSRYFKSPGYLKAHYSKVH